MKINKLILVGLAVSAIAGAASAQTVINIVGSTAFRAAVTDALQNEGVFTAPPAYAYVTSISGNQAIFSGTISGIGACYVRTSWSGSVEGARTLSDPVTYPDGGFIPTSATLSTSGTAYTGALVHDPTNLHLSFSDVYQASTGVTSVSFTDTAEGVVTFIWASGKGSPAGLTNVTTQMANAINSVGRQPLSLFTGVVSDGSKTVYKTGRYNGSGSRATELAETGYGVFKNVKQYMPSTSGSQVAVSGTINTLQLWPTSGGIANGTPDATAGNGGFTSGSGIRDAIGCVMSSTVAIKNAAGTTTSTPLGSNIVFLASLGTGDQSNANAAGSVPLTYNGVPFSVNNVENGNYTFWGYEHLFQLNPGSNETAFVTALEAVLPNAITNTTAGVNITDMNVSRTQDGGLVGP